MTIQTINNACQELTVMVARLLKATIFRNCQPILCLQLVSMVTSLICKKLLVAKRILHTQKTQPFKHLNEHITE